MFFGQFECLTVMLVVFISYIDVLQVYNIKGLILTMNIWTVIKSLNNIISLLWTNWIIYIYIWIILKEGETETASKRRRFILRRSMNLKN